MSAVFYVGIGVGPTVDPTEIESLDDFADEMQSRFDAATTVADGLVELATEAEAVTGTDTARAITPANLTARLAAPGAIGGTTPAAGDFTTLAASSVVTLKGTDPDTALKTDTSDGTDNKRVLLTGAGGLAASRGALLQIAGNEFSGGGASLPVGSALFAAGLVAGAQIRFDTITSGLSQLEAFTLGTDAKAYFGGNVCLGTTSVPSGGGTPVFVLADAGSDPTGVPADHAGLVNKSGELYAFDENGNVTLISPHSANAPDALIDYADGMPDRVVLEINVYAGKLRWTNETRRNRLLESPLTTERQPITLIETFDRYNARHGLAADDRGFMTVQSWDENERTHEQRSLQAIARWREARRRAKQAQTAWERRQQQAKDAGIVLLESPPPTFTDAKPKAYRRRPKLAWLD